MVVENKIEIERVGQNTSNKEPRTQSQLTGSLSNMVYISSRVSVYRKGPNNASNAGGLEFKIKDKILGLLTKTINKIDIKAIKQKDQR